MTRKQIRDKILEITKRRDKTTLADSGIDEGLTTMCGLHKFKALNSTTTVALTAAQTEFEIGDHKDSVIEFHVGYGLTGYHLPIRTIEECNAIFPNVGSQPQSLPKICCEMENGTFRLFPKPDRSLTLYVTKRTLPVIAAADASENPVSLLDNALVHYGCYYVFHSIEQYAAANAETNAWTTQFRVAVAQDKFTKSEIKARPFVSPTTRHETVIITGNDNVNHTFQGNFNL